MMSIGLIIIALGFLGVLYFLGKNYWKPFFWIFNLFFKGALGALGIYLFNLIGAWGQLQVPLNPYNAIFTGFLGAPGLASLLIMRYWIKI